jgi:hypothetical protein
MKDEEGAGRTAVVLLPQNVLIASDALGASAAQMAAGHKTRATASWSHGRGEIKKLDIEGLTRGLEDRVNV